LRQDFSIGNAQVMFEPLLRTRFLAIFQ
jgi:hypothetical protein